MPSNSWIICVICRKGWRGAATCAHKDQAQRMHHNFRLPKKNNDRAWKLLARGIVNTEQSRADAHYDEAVKQLYFERVSPLTLTWQWGAYYASRGRDFWVKRRFPVSR